MENQSEKDSSKEPPNQKTIERKPSLNVNSNTFVPTLPNKVDTNTEYHDLA